MITAVSEREMHDAVAHVCISFNIVKTYYFDIASIFPLVPFVSSSLALFSLTSKAIFPVLLFSPLSIICAICTNG